jgi:pimeloyl-ACP methyl ester carboxylesterase
MTGEGTALRQTWTPVGGVVVHARVASGRAPAGAPPVVLVHGLTVSSRYMVPLVQSLAPYFPVFAPDLPGFGRSSAPRRVLDLPGLADALAAWMGATGLERAILVGNSLGCQVIVQTVLRHPHRARAIVLVGPTMDPHGRSALEQVRRLLIDSVREPPSSYPILVRDLLAAGVRRTVSTFYAGMADRMESHLPLVRLPALVVRGSRDPIAPQRWVEEAAGLLPAGRLAIVHGAAHAVNYSSPAALAAIVRDFVDRSASPSGWRDPPERPAQRPTA